MSRHADFEKIYAQFQDRYGEDGENNYLAWLTLMALDETKPYSNEDQFSESFGWARTLITRLKEEDGRRLYKVDAAFPLSSMNRNVYTEEELIQAARMLRLVTPNLNHTDYKLPFTVEGAQYEEGAVELLVSTSLDALCPKGYKYVDMLEHSEDVPEEYHIIHVSIEGDCTDTEETDEGNACVGLGFTGIAFLTKKVLPGIPLTRIVPVERIVESFSPSGESPMSEEKEKPETDNKPKLKSEQTVVDPDAPTVDQRLEWLEYDVSYIRDEMWALREAMELQFAAVGKRIDDALVLLTGVKVNAETVTVVDGAESKTVEVTVEPGVDPKEQEPEPVCGDCTSYVDGKCEEDDSERTADTECSLGSFTPKAEPKTETVSEPFADYDDMDDCIAKNQDKDDPAAYCATIKKQAEESYEEETTSEPEKQEAEEPEEAESGEETAPEEVEESIEAPTKFSYIKRYNELKAEGKSARDAWRLAGFEMIEHLQR